MNAPNVEGGWVADPAGRLLADAIHDFAEAVAPGIGPMERNSACRRAVLFAALAAEAYVNAFLQEQLTGSEFEAVDRLSTPEKYMIGVRLATGNEVFRRGTEPAASLVTLFKIRDRIVHTKNRDIPVRLDDPAWQKIPLPTTTARGSPRTTSFVVAGAACTLSEITGADTGFAGRILAMDRHGLERALAAVPVPALEIVADALAERQRQLADQQAGNDEGPLASRLSADGAFAFALRHDQRS